MEENKEMQEYKQKVLESLLEWYELDEAERMMKIYEDDFQEFYDKEWSPTLVRCAMIMGY